MIKWGMPGGSSGKEPTCQCRLDLRDAGLIPGSGRPLEEDMASPTSTLAYRNSWTEEPGKQQFIGSHRVGHD